MYTSIFELAKQHNFKKFYVERDTWNKNNYARIDAIITDSKTGNYAKVIGYCKYASGDYEYKMIDCACCGEWKFLSALEEDILLIEDADYYQKFKWKKVYSRKQYDNALEKIKNKILLK